MPSCRGQVPVDLAAYEAAKASEPEFYRAGDSMLYGVRCSHEPCLFSLFACIGDARCARLSIRGACTATMRTLHMACALQPVYCGVVASF